MNPEDESDGSVGDSRSDEGDGDDEARGVTEAGHVQEDGAGVVEQERKVSWKAKTAAWRTSRRGRSGRRQCPRGGAEKAGAEVHGGHEAKKMSAEVSKSAQMSTREVERRAQGGTKQARARPR